MLWCVYSMVAENLLKQEQEYASPRTSVVDDDYHALSTYLGKHHFKPQEIDALSYLFSSFSKR
jgi:hypothetical protein